jgi:mono/diheme cytochrome c family protein
MGRLSRFAMMPLLVALAACGVKRQEVAVVDTAPKTGKELYEHWCAACHDPGPGHPGTLRMAGDFGAEHSVLIGKEGLDKETVRFAVRNGFNMMPPFRVTEISDAELELLAAHVTGEKK